MLSIEHIISDRFLGFQLTQLRTGWQQNQEVTDLRRRGKREDHGPLTDCQGKTVASALILRRILAPSSSRRSDQILRAQTLYTVIHLIISTLSHEEGSHN